MKGVRLLLLAGAIALALAAPSSAGSSKVIRLAWSERATEGSRTVMTFSVRSLTVVRGRWTVTGGFRNTSGATLRIRNQFAVLYGPSSVRVNGMKALGAKSFSPPLPVALASGKGWSGKFSGTGAAALKRTHVRMQFGYFQGRALPGRPGFGWITDHVARIN